MFSRKTAGIFPVLICLTMAAISRALGSLSVETPSGRDEGHAVSFGKISKGIVG